MKTILKLSLLLSFLFSTAVAVHSQAYQKDKSTLSVGYGAGTLISAYFNEADKNTFNYSTTGPIYFKYGYTITDKLEFGVNFAYAQYKANWTDTYYDSYYNSITYNYHTTYTTTSTLARLSWHFGNVKHLDPYFGFGVGYRTGKEVSESNDPNYDTSSNAALNFPFGMEATIGARYYFTDSFGLYAETGASKSVLQFGATIRF